MGLPNEQWNSEYNHQYRHHLGFVQGAEVLVEFFPHEAEEEPAYGIGRQIEGEEHPIGAQPVAEWPDSSQQDQVKEQFVGRCRECWQPEDSRAIGICVYKTLRQLGYFG